MASFRRRGCTCKNKKRCSCGATWEYRITYTDRQTGKRREKTKGGFRTKKEAEIAAIEEESKINHFGFAENGNELFSTYIEDWLEVYKKPNVKPITYSIQERNVRLNILPRWGNYRMNEISRTEYQKWINELRKRYSEGTTRRIHSIMSNAMNDAVHEFRILRDNPIQRITVPKENKVKDINFYTKEQLDKLLNQLKIPQKNAKYKHSIQYYALFTLMARTGIRIGEALALTWDDFNEKDATLTINKTLVYPLNSEPYISTPKSKKSIRTIALDEPTIKILKKHRINRKELYLRYPNYKQPKNNIMFHQHKGRWLRTNVTRDYFKINCKRAGVPVYSPHSLRHTHAVHLLEAGVNIKYVSERLGHASIKVTADTYLHITDKIESDALELYERYIEK